MTSMVAASLRLSSEESELIDEIRRLFEAADTDGNQAITVDELMTLMTKARRKPVSVEEATALCEKMDRNNDRVIDWEDLKSFMIGWLRENRRGKGSAVGDAVIDRSGVHASIGMFFSQFESVDKDELMQRLFDSTLPLEGDLETLFRGDPQYTPEQRRQKLEHTLKLFESTDARVVEAEFYALEAEMVLRAVTRLRDMLELVEVFSCEHHRFLLRPYILRIYQVLVSQPGVVTVQGEGMQLPFMRLNWLLNPSLATHMTPALTVTVLQALYYFLLGPRLPSATFYFPCNHETSNMIRFHPDNFIQFKAQLHVQQAENAYGKADQCSVTSNLRNYIVLALATDASAQALEACEWACKALGAFVEQHDYAASAALEEGYMATMMDVTRALMDRYRRNDSEALSTTRTLRAATYALAVLCGHTHAHAHTHDTPFEAFLRSKQAVVDSTYLVEVLIERVNEAMDTGVCSNLVLALQNAARYLPPAPGASLEKGPEPLVSAECTSLRFSVLETVLKVLHKGWSHEAGIPVYLTVFSALLDDMTKHGKLLDYAIATRSLDDPLRCVLTLPTAHSRLTLLGIEVLRLGAERHKFHWVKLFTEPLISLLQREQADMSERVLKTIQLMFNAEPSVICTLISYGIIPALFSTFPRFRQHDNVLASVYGMVGFVYNVETVLTASRVIEAVAKKEDAGVQAAFLQALALDDVEKIAQLHRQMVNELRRKMPGKYLRITDAYSKNSTTQEKIQALNECLRSQLLHIRRLCDDHPSASTSTISSHIQLNILHKWRADLTPLINANMIGDSMIDPMQATDDMCVLECENMDGLDMEVTLVPKTPNWPAQPVVVYTKTTVSLEEVHRFIYSHYHVSPVKVFIPSRQTGTQAACEILGDVMLQTYLTSNVSTRKAELELQLMVSVAWPDAPGQPFTGSASMEPPSNDAVEAELHKDKLRIPPQLLGMLRDYFKQPDKMWGGRDLSWQEFQAFLTYHNWSQPPASVKMLFDIFDADCNGRLSYIELARLLALMCDENSNERVSYLYKRHANGQGELTVEGLTQMLNHTDSSQPEKHNRRMAEQWFQRKSVSVAQTMSEDVFKECLADGLRDSLQQFFWLRLSARGGGGDRKRRGEWDALNNEPPMRMMRRMPSMDYGGYGMGGQHRRYPSDGYSRGYGGGGGRGGDYVRGRGRGRRDGPPHRQYDDGNEMYTYGGGGGGRGRGRGGRGFGGGRGRGGRGRGFAPRGRPRDADGDY